MLNSFSCVDDLVSYFLYDLTYLNPTLASSSTLVPSCCSMLLLTSDVLDLSEGVAVESGSGCLRPHWHSTRRVMKRSVMPSSNEDSLSFSLTSFCRIPPRFDFKSMFRMAFHIISRSRMLERQSGRCSISNRAVTHR